MGQSRTLACIWQIEKIIEERGGLSSRFYKRLAEKDHKIEQLSEKIREYECAVDKTNGESKGILEKKNEVNITIGEY